MATMILPASISCPECAEPITSDAPCPSCSLDTSLLYTLHQGANDLALRAIRAAVGGAWQEAYDLAAESLRVSRHENDAAAFVLLLASLAGARGSVRSVPEPSAEKFPPALVPHVLQVVELARRARALAASEGDIEAEMAELQQRNPGLFPILSGTSTRPADQERSKPWSVAVVALVGLVVGGLVGWLLRPYETAPLPEATSSASQPVPTPSEDPRSIDQGEAFEGQREELERLRALDAVERAALSDRWIEALEHLVALPEDTPRQLYFEEVLRRGSLAAWRAGRDASARGRYQEAAKLLEVASVGPKDSYYYNNTLYYLARAYHRMDRHKAAAVTYRRLLDETQGPEFLTDARRYLEQVDPLEEEGNP